MNRLFGVAFAAAVLLSCSAPQLGAQTMEQVLNRLFVFSTGDDPLFLAGTATDATVAFHGDHFIPGAVASNGAVLGVFTSAIGDNIGNFPLSSTVASQTFTFVGGVPTPTSRSFGPILSERAQTLGSGRFDVGFSYSSINFDRIRGTPMNDLRLAFIHDNVDPPGCDAALGGDCTDFGLPLLEHDVIDLGVDLDVRAEIYAFNATFGVRNWLDVGLAVPVVKLKISGASEARILSSNLTNIAHFFGGTLAQPVLSARTISSGNTSGIGDVAARLKLRVSDGKETGIALLGEVRLPTGRKEDFLGTGETSVLGMFIASATMGDFAPHLNFGYVSRQGEGRANALQFASGFDQRLSDWATFIVDLLGEFKTDDSLTFPEPVTSVSPFVRTIDLTNIPNIRDNILDGSVGIKLRTEGGIVIWANALIALNDGGMRAGVVSTFGFQYTTR